MTEDQKPSADIIPIGRAREEAERAEYIRQLDELTPRKKAALHAAHRFKALADAQEDIQTPGKMSSLDVAACALHAKEEAENDYGAQITATLDEEGNWSFA